MDILKKLEIETRGSVEIITNYSQNLEDVKNYCLSISTDTIVSQEDYKKGFTISKEIKEAQLKIKELIKSLDNVEVQDLKEELKEIDKILAGKNTSVKKKLEEYKEKQKLELIEFLFDDIVFTKDFNSDKYKFEIYEAYKKDCLLQFKGKSKFEEMSTITSKITQQYSEKLELQQLKFDNTFLSLKNYCVEIGIIQIDEDLITKTLNIIKFNKDIENTKKELYKYKLLQEKMEQDKLIKEEIKEKIKEEIKEEIKKVEDKIEIDNNLMLTFTIKTTKQKIVELKNYLINNNITIIKEA